MHFMRGSACTQHESVWRNGAESCDGIWNVSEQKRESEMDSDDDCQIIDERDVRRGRDREEDRYDPTRRKKRIDLEPTNDLTAIAAQLSVPPRVRLAVVVRFVIVQSSHAESMRRQSSDRPRVHVEVLGIVAQAHTTADLGVQNAVR